MAKKDPRNTRRKIVTTARKLFYEQGYDSTTVDQIISESGTSKGPFYHYFNGKDALLSSLSSLFDDKYEELMKEIDPEMNSFDKLLLLNRELFQVIDPCVRGPDEPDVCYPTDHHGGETPSGPRAHLL